MKKFILTITFVLQISSYFFVLAQDPLTNLKKYWHYRYRLVNYFMVIGDGPGKSLPAGVRNLWNGDILHWGDVPRYQGWYIGMLATEYRLLKDNQQSVNQTLRELYHALKAIERLDIIAETQWQLPGSVNGCLLRDDIPEDFVSNYYNELNQGITPNQWPIITVGSGKPGEVKKSCSCFHDGSCVFVSNTCQRIMSQDHIAHLLMGYALVVKFLDNGPIQFTDYINNNPNLPVSITADFKQMVRNETDLIVSYMQSNHGDTWMLNYPDGSDVPNELGGDVRVFAWGFAAAAQYNTGSFSYFAGANPALWQTTQSNCTRVNNSNLHISLALAAVGNSWVDIIGNNNTLQKILDHGDYNSSSAPCTYFENHFGWDILYGAVWGVLHGGLDYITDFCKAEQILNSAFGDGPFYHDAFDKGYPGWATSNRFMDASPQQHIGDDNFKGNYNGLDYMLFHNLYYLLNSGEAYITGTFPAYWNIENNPWPQCEFEFWGLPPIGSIPPKFFTRTDKHINVNNLNVTNLTETCLNISNTFYGDVRITGGAPGVTLTNTHVGNGGRLHVGINIGCSVNPNSYLFDPSAYQKINGNNNNNETLPPYIMTEEFKQIAVPDIAVYPNPSNGIFIVESKNKIQDIQVTDVLGNVIYQSTISNLQSVINLSNQPKGIYFLKVQSADGKIYTEKIILSAE